MDSTLYPPDSESPQESSEDNLDNDSLDEFGPVAADSGVSEVGSQLSEEAGAEVGGSTVSVSEEIKRFQREINSVASENSRFFTWKQQRAGQLRQFSVSSENLAVRGGGGGSISNSSSPPEVSEPEPRVRHLSERNSSYADKEVTVLGLPEEIPTHLVVRGTHTQHNVNVASERSRQIQPSSHVAPSYLPTGESTEAPPDEEDGVTEDLSGEDEEDDVPALPSVKTLTNKFQAFSCQSSLKKPTVKVSPTRLSEGRNVSRSDYKVFQLQENKAAARARLPVLVKQRYNNNNNSSSNNNTAYKQVRGQGTGVTLGLITLSSLPVYFR